MTHRALTCACAALAALLVSAPQAFPCGVKVKLKTPDFPGAERRSQHPTHVLMLGVRSGSLRRGLLAAGHRVDQGATPSSAPQGSYGVIVTRRELADEAAERWPDARIVIVSGGTRASLAAVEESLERAPVPSRRRRAEYARARRQRLEEAPATRRPAATVARPTIESAPPPPSDEPKPPPVPASPPPPLRVDDDDDLPAAPADGPAMAFNVVIEFEKGATPRSGHERRLERVVAWLKRNPQARVEVHGHTDSRGSARVNREVGMWRAEAVKQLLVERGIDADRILTFSHGEDEPISLEHDANRRVEIRPAAPGK